MNIRKFGVKPKYILSKTIKWIPLQYLKYPPEKINSTTWRIFSQKNIELKPIEVKQVTIGLGFMISEGVVLISLSNSLKEKSCSLQNEVNIENTNDIITSISNNHKQTVRINENELLCFVSSIKL